MEIMKKKLNFPAIASRVAMLLVFLFLIIYLVTILLSSSEFFTDSAEKNAELCFEEDIDRANLLASQHYDNLYEISERLNYSESKNEVRAILGEYIGSEKFGNLRYFLRGQCYDVYGTPILDYVGGYEHISALASKRTQGCTPVYLDVTTQLDCVAFYIPIIGSDHVDGLLSVVPARNVINVGSIINDKASVVAIIDPSGRVLSDMSRDTLEESVGNNFYEFIDKITHNKTDSIAIASAVAQGKKTALSIDTTGVGYTVAIAPLANFGNNVLLVSMSESNGLIAPELTYIRHIVNLLLIAILAIVIGLGYAMLYHRKTKMALSVATLVDIKVDCPNAEQFRITAKDLMATYRHKYSVTVLSIRNFLYINEQLGEEASNEFLRSLAKIIDSTSTAEECFGYAGDGKFLVLMINANSHSVSDKIKLIETIASRSEQLADNGIKLRFAAGVYNVFSGHKRTVQEMIDCATTASGYSEDNIKTTFTLFTEDVKAEIEHNEKIEAMMESALKNREFRLFLQPKYDVRHDTIHSAEALVRWFDPRKGDYMFPADFIPLFETNGFIVKLDHFVYIEVLEYLSKAAEKGEKVVPVAVNVSRVTATSPDFINFYVGNKKKYRVPDGFITLELTESFAMESYENISSIISALHNGGMRCSIDDFGSGYSSFSILKQINVDELKLDSVFIKRGIDIRRDDKLLVTIIDLAKSMGMSVVQEGVETKEIFDKVIEMGCDIIQGYYYAKAISVEEFKLFINTNTSIKYKALVK